MPAKRGRADTNLPRKLRQACDFCHGVKIRCSGGNPCSKCHKSDLRCHYSFMSKMGKPRGSGKKDTAAKLAAHASGRHLTSGEMIVGNTDGRVKDQETACPTIATSYPSDNNDSQLSRWSSDDESLGLAAGLPLGMGSVSALFSGTNWQDVDNIKAGKTQQMNASRIVPTPSSEDDMAVAWQDDWTVADTPGMNNEWQQLLSDYQSPFPDFSFHSSDLSTPSYGIPTHRSNTSAHSQDVPSSCQTSSFASKPDTGTATDELQFCSCLERLAANLCHLNSLEHRSKGPIQIDTALREADATLKCADGTLECKSCRPDSKVLLLVVTVLQMVMNWIQIHYQQGKHQLSGQILSSATECTGPPPPRVQIGSWKVSEADGNLIKVILTSRILASSSRTLATLRLCADEFALVAPVYQILDVESLRHMLQKLATSVQELGRYVPCHSVERITS
ncbi:hypothetical protein F4803DRAFT_505783 [Xylaria telfairii]|nr:hypothetical protein F4803DRAFT_505783 [Xylaria telfairii]